MEDRYIETHKTWNIIAKQYEEKFMELDLYNGTYKIFCDLLSKKNTVILEIGCGPGNITNQILRLNPTLKILATDVSTNMISLAKKNNPTIKTQVLDCRNLKTVQNTFNGIICGFIIPYLSKKDCSKLISDCANILDNKGVLYLSFVNGYPEKSGFISGSSGNSVYFYYHELETIKKELKLHNMLITNIIEKEYKKSDSTFETHTILIAKKSNNKQ
ncbi:class I SAM-dependent methyltransferase [Tenacibaculum sp. AHE15PA]|uniref:class I SAM-dependent methyltransferase n=1 Tax=unclassified Tenacibaculum TaxID=2635139 RepID=UPI001C4FC5F5|nr:MULTISPECIES: class I SAM-dependent methyltransferase [unclassified Tenacibaculum]QXP74452.1 class I SAM-dependent methyltransferase [Tenacibaculum sp. AHE14PA]QXP75179.1 class I SAM-dependent methyltransferase [Tenacibaculum sp. AHE15PA]